MNILFDIGGTKTRVASALSSDSFNDPVIFETPRDYEEGIEKLKQAIVSLSKGGRVERIVGGIAGPFSERKASLIGSPNLSGWIGKPLVADLESAFQCRVHVENDSAMVALGEAVFGAGKDFPIVAYLTISTGVGGARIVNGKIDERSIGFEPGHQIIDADSTLMPEADGMYLGNLISGKAIEKRMGKKPVEITDPAFWEGMARILAYGLNNTIVHWSPDAVVLGGSMMNKVGISVEAVEKHLKDILKIYPELPALRKSMLGDLGGLYGGLAFLRQNR